MIEIQNLSKMHKSSLTLDNLNFTIQPGMITGFVGPNGAGKSTTMRCMTDLDAHSGQVLFGGYQYSNLTNPMSQVGVMLDAKIFHPKRKAIDHLLMYAKAIGVDSARVNQVVDLVGLNSVINDKTGTYSLGMAQRLSIAVALLGDPNYIILDEPANGLDPDGIYWLRSLLKYFADMGKVVFLSSHLLNEVAQLADHIVVIGRGKIIADKPLKDLIKENSVSQVYIRISEPQIHFESFKELTINYKREGDGILISGVTTDEVSKFLSDKSITPLELSSRESSLEDVYLNVTKGDVEYTPYNQNSTNGGN